MSAFAVKVTSDKQTLILKGEPFPPPRLSASGTGASRADTGVQLQRVTMLLVQEDFAAPALASDSSAAKFLAAPAELALLPSAAAIDAPATSAQSLVPYSSSSNRYLSAGAAEYARTQNLSGDRTRSQLIDTYA
jgi:hypothetical protein